ncbi:MAG: hypothetical protein ACREDT_17075, partial [Methylocella sp.]
HATYHHATYHHATYHYVFKGLNADALSRALGRFGLGADASGHIAIDGKTLRGRRRLDDKSLHTSLCMFCPPSRPGFQR